MKHVVGYNSTQNFKAEQTRSFFAKNLKNKDVIAKTYNVDNSTSIESIIKTFFNEELKEHQRYFLILKVKISDYGWRSLHHAVVVTKSNSKLYAKFVRDHLETLTDEYQDTGHYEKLAFNYFLIARNRWPQFPEHKWMHIARLASPVISIDNFHKKYNIPLNIDYSSWGDVSKDSNKNLMFIEGKNKYTIQISKKENTIHFSKDNISFVDHILSEQYFKRTYKNFTYYIDAHTESIVFKIKAIKTNYLQPTSEYNVNDDEEAKIMKDLIIDERFNNPKIGTFDVETIVHNGLHKAYLYSFHDGKKKHSFFCEKPGDISTCKEMLLAMLKQKYNAYIFYAHNFSGFDIHFIISGLSQLKQDGYNITFMKNSDKFINISITFHEKRVSINLRDSMLMLPMGLAKLGAQFKVDTLKSTEPVYTNLKDKNNPFLMTDLSHYSKDIEKVENFNEWKEKVINYCEMDCVSLYEIIIQFRSLVFNQWRLFIENYPTTPSLAFGVFRRHYLKPDTIPIYTGKVFEFLRASFTGGSTDMYRPYGRNVYCYDANSLYPSVMFCNKFPVGQTYEFTGNIEILYEIDKATWKKSSSYFIADSDIQTTRELYQPYLQINHLGKEDGLPEKRTISPNGSFTMKINSCEYHNAIKRGDYKISTKQGYLWKSDFVFKDYVFDLYKARLSYDKSDPLNLLFKNVLNSTFGRFAITPIVSQTILLSKDEYVHKFTEDNIIESYDDIDKENILVTYRPKIENEGGREPQPSGKINTNY